MVTGCNGNSISAKTVCVLWINVVVNLYNLVIIWLNDDSATQILLGFASEMKQYIIVIEILISVFAIMLSNMQNTSLILSITYWVMALTSALLLLDAILACEIAINLFFDKGLKVGTNHTRSAVPGNIYLIVVIILAFYIGFKFYAVCVILRLGKILSHRTEGSVNDLLLLNEVNIGQSTASIVRVHTVSSIVPPSYDDSIMEPIGTPPPPYRSPVRNSRRTRKY